MLLALCAALAGCDAAEAGDIEPLPPLQRPSAEARAGLPEVAGRWRFAGFEILPGDTAAVRADSTRLIPPGDLVVQLQRLDSIAGVYARGGAEFPFVGEVRRDGVVAVVVAAPDGTRQFAAGQVVRDTLWLELTSFSSAQAWPAGTRAALVRTPVEQPFRRFVGGRAIPLPVDSAALDSMRMADSLAAARRDSAAAAGVPVTPPAATPAPAAQRPQPRPTAPPVRQPPAPTPTTPEPTPPPAQRPPVQRPPVTPPVQRPPVRTTPPPRRDTVRIPTPQPLPRPRLPDPVLPEPIPIRPAPAETIRLGRPPR